MNSLDIRSSQSSYGEPTPFAAAASYGAPQPPPSKVLMEGYRDALDPQPAEKPRYAPVGVPFPTPLATRLLITLLRVLLRSIPRIPKAPNRSTPMTQSPCTC